MSIIFWFENLLEEGRSKIIRKREIEGEEGLDGLRGDAQKGGGHGGLQELGAAERRPHPGVRSSSFSPLLEPLSLYQPRDRPAVGPVLPGGHPGKMCAGLFSLGRAGGARSLPRGAAPWLHWTTGCLNSEDLAHPRQGQALSLREAAVEKEASAMFSLLQKTLVRPLWGA